MLEATLYFDFQMTIHCPYCQQRIDLEDDDIESDNFYHRKLVRWISNEKDADEIGENIEEQCPGCEKNFKVAKHIAR